MLKKYNNILKYNDGNKSLKAPFVIELDIVIIYRHNPKKTSTERKAKHETSG